MSEGSSKPNNLISFPEMEKLGLQIERVEAIQDSEGGALFFLPAGECRRLKGEDEPKAVPKQNRSMSAALQAATAAFRH